MKIDISNIVNRMLFLRGLSIISVVMGHVNGWAFTAMFWWTHRYRSVSVPNYDQVGSFNYYGIRVLEQFVVFCLCAFIFISGYFMARSAGEENTVSWNAILKRIKRLIPPYILWATVMLILDNLQGAHLTPLDFVVKITTGTVSEEYFFPVLLIQFYLISPFIIPLARSKWKPLLIVSALIHLILTTIKYFDLLGIDLSLSRPIYLLTTHQVFLIDLFWYSLGLVTYFHFDTIKKFLNRFKVALVIGVVATFTLGILEWEYIFKLSSKDWLGYNYTIIDSFYIALVILTFIAFIERVPVGSNLVTNVGNKSYGIYLLHPIVVEFSARLIYHLTPALLAYQLVFYIILVIVGTGVPYLMMKLAVLPPLDRYYELAFGRR